MDSPFKPQNATTQANIHQQLLVARKTWLSDALHDALADVDPTTLKLQLAEYVPADAGRLLAVAGIRDEAVFPVPVVVIAKPSLVAYYRLLLGVSQKRFYSRAAGMSRFKRMEAGAPLTTQLTDQLPDFCRSMCRVLADLVILTVPAFEIRDVEDLQLLTLGSYYYGSANNTIGQTATRGVFSAMTDIVKDYVTSQSADELRLSMPDGRTLMVKVASDPDMRIVELQGDDELPLVSIEIKGGTDKANAYNRGGEAEKSHQGAKSRGYTMCWTIIHTANVDMDKLVQGSPTTNLWFDTNELLVGAGEGCLNFSQQVKHVLGLSHSPQRSQ